MFDSLCVVYGSYFMGRTNIGVERKGHLLLDYEAGWGMGKAHGMRDIIYCDVTLLFMNKK